MTATGRLLAAALLIWLAPGPAAADWHITPFVGKTFADDTNLALEFVSQTKFVFGGTVTLIGEGVFGLEADFGYSPRYFQRSGSQGLVSSDSLMTLMGNGVVAPPLRWVRYSLRPFASGGVGLIRAAKDDTGNVFPTRASLLGFNVGGGVIGFVSDRRGLRLDLRYARNLSGGDEDLALGGTTHLHFWRASAGLILKY